MTKYAKQLKQAILDGDIKAAKIAAANMSDDELTLTVQYQGMLFNYNELALNFGLDWSQITAQRTVRCKLNFCQTSTPHDLQVGPSIIKAELPLLPAFTPTPEEDGIENPVGLPLKRTHHLAFEDDRTTVTQQESPKKSKPVSSFDVNFWTDINVTEPDKTEDTTVAEQDNETSTNLDGNPVAGPSCEIDSVIKTPSSPLWQPQKPLPSLKSADDSEDEEPEEQPRVSYVGKGKKPMQLKSA